MSHWTTINSILTLRVSKKIELEQFKENFENKFGKVFESKDEFNDIIPHGTERSIKYFFNTSEHDDHDYKIYITIVGNLRGFDTIGQFNHLYHWCGKIANEYSDPNDYTTSISGGFLKAEGSNFMSLNFDFLSD